METFVCWRCKEAKPIADFYSNKSRKRGVSYRCKPCDKAMSREWRKNNRDLNNKIVLKWKREHRDETRASNAKSKTVCRENQNQAQRRRTENIKNATPLWLTDEHHAEIEKTYQAARVLREVTGMKYEVDHMHAISGENYCGLNVPWNLQIVTAAENAAKGRNLPEFHSHLAWGG